MGAMMKIIVADLTLCAFYFSTGNSKRVVGNGHQAPDSLD
jgi:hypothetical protein